jgi:hypothetical protein
MADDVNVLIEDGAIDVKFGGSVIRVRGLNIESSVQWTKRVKARWFEQAQKNQSVVDAAAALGTETEKFALFRDSMLCDNVGGDLLMIRDLVMEHSPTVLTMDVVNQGTAQQIAIAFDALYELENPTRKLRATMARG